MDFDHYTQPVVDEARRRGIEVRALPELGPGYAELVFHGQREFICQGLTNRTGAVVFKVLFHKAAALRLLAEQGIPTPPMLFTADVNAARHFGADRKLVVKPADRSFGVGVTVAPGARGFDKAFAWAAGLSRDVEKRVLVQEHVEGADYRILVIGKQRVYGVRCEPAHVVGSGEHTIADLIEDWNYGVLVDARKIRIDRTLERQIALEGFTLASVPPNNAVVWLSRRANTHRGAFAHDCTELLGDEVIERCIGIAEAFGADHVGVDIISPDITHDAGVVIELNPHAAMTLHTQPTTGKARNVPAAVVDSLFPTSR